LSTELTSFIIYLINRIVGILMKLSSIKKMPVLIDGTSNKKINVRNQMDVSFRFFFFQQENEDWIYRWTDE